MADGNRSEEFSPLRLDNDLLLRLYVVLYRVYRVDFDVDILGVELTQRRTLCGAGIGVPLGGGSPTG